MTKILATYAALMLICAGLTVSGIYVMAGLGWSLIAGGVFFLGFSEILRRGMTGGS